MGREIKTAWSKLTGCYTGYGRTVGAKIEAHRSLLNAAAAIIGCCILVVGLADNAQAQLTGRYNDQRISNAVNTVFTYIEGSFGALVMVCAGVGAIMSSAFGQYRAALGLMVVALGSYTLRSFVATFFNVETSGG